MKFAIDVAPLGDLSDPRAVVRLARAAEASGWDGFSVWDNLGTEMGGAGEAFVTLAAVASATERLALIASVVILPRRRPQLVAQAAATLDRLSDGRLILGVGAGGDPIEFEAFGEETDPSGRARLLDEAVGIVDRFLCGETVTHEGPGYVVRGVGQGPRPEQQPRPPIWVGAMRPGGIRRAARWDGWIALAMSEDGSSMALTPEVFGAMVDRVRAERAALGRAGEHFDVALFAQSGPDDVDTVRAYEAAGATWWLETLSGLRGSVDDLLAIVEAGPPGR